MIVDSWFLVRRCKAHEHAGWLFGLGKRTILTVMAWDESKE